MASQGQKECWQFITRDRFSPLTLQFGLLSIFFLFKGTLNIWNFILIPTTVIHWYQNQLTLGVLFLKCVHIYICLKWFIFLWEIILTGSFPQVLPTAGTGQAQDSTDLILGLPHGWKDSSTWPLSAAFQDAQQYKLDWHGVARTRGRLSSSKWHDLVP